MPADNSPLDIVVFSSTQFGHRCLTEGISKVANVKVKGILTTPSTIQVGYSAKPLDVKTHADFSILAKQLGCEVAVMNEKMSNDAYLKHLNVWKPHLILVLGWYYIIPRIVREIAPLKCMGIHASLLPKFRGGSPIPWAIIEGEKETGVSFFYLEDGIDKGDIVAQKSFLILEDDTCVTVYEKAIQASAKILQEQLPLIAAGKASRTPQNHEAATQFPPRKPEDGLIDWSWSAKKIRNFIRAQTKPYPGAFTFIEGKKVIIWDASILEEEKP